jgi:toxin ParE1/3/4
VKRRRIVYSETADRDLLIVLRWIAENSSPAAALSIVEDIERFISTLDLASERGTARDDLAPGLRVVTYRRAEIAIYVSAGDVTIARIFYGGQDWEAPFGIRGLRPASAARASSCRLRV